MLKKIVVITLISGFAAASFAQAGVKAPSPAKPAAPAATLQKAKMAKPVKHHAKKQHHHHKKTATKTPVGPAK